MTDHVDMSQFIAARSDQLNADDLLDAPRTITITKVTASPDSAEQPVSVHYEGDDGKPFKPCKTVRRIMVGVWGKDASKYIGRSMTLYRDPAVAFGGMQVGGLRVSHMSDISENKTVALQVTRGRKAPHTVKPLVGAPAAKPESADPKRAKAETWLAWFKNELAAAENPVEVFADAESTLARMKAQYADIYDEAMKLAPNKPTQPASTEDPEFAKSIADIAAAPDEATVTALDQKTDAHRTFLTDAQCEQLDEALSTRRAELRVKAEA